MSKRFQPQSSLPHPPTLWEMASFLATVAGVTHHPGADKVAAWLINQSSDARQMLDEIALLAEDAGIALNAATACEVLSLNDALDRLLATQEAIQPLSVLQIAGESGFDYCSLLRLIDGRCRRAEEEANALKALARTLGDLDLQAL